MKLLLNCYIHRNDGQQYNLHINNETILNVFTLEFSEKFTLPLPIEDLRDLSEAIV